MEGKDNELPSEEEQLRNKEQKVRGICWYHGHLIGEDILLISGTHFCAKCVRDVLLGQGAVVVG